MSELRGIATDPAVAVALARRAISGRDAPAAANAQFLVAIEREIDAGNAEGVLRFVDGRAVGVALWESRGEFGTALELLYLEPPHQNGTEYVRFFAEVRERAGPIVFAPAFFAGLAETEERAMMTAAGFAPYARTEMRAALDAPRSAEPAPRPGLRTTRPSDLAELARLHELAYRDSFDQFLFMIYPDPRRDAELALQEIFSGRWGELLTWASPVIERGSELVAACLVTRAWDGPIVVNMIVDPRCWGQGLGRAVLEEAMRALREKGEPAVLLTVTDGNDRARRLYERLGFVPAHDPYRGWYALARIPTTPGAGQAGFATTGGSSST